MFFVPSVNLYQYYQCDGSIFKNAARKNASEHKKESKKQKKRDEEKSVRDLMVIGLCVFTMTDKSLYASDR